MSKFEIKNIVPVSQAYYSLDSNMQIIDSNSGGEVCYNVPKEFVNKALDVNALILDSQIKQNRKNESNEVYILSDNYSLILGKSLKWFIDEKDENTKYKLIIVKRTNGKFVMAKADFRALESTDDGYKWFNKLYDKSVEGFVICYSVDDALKKIIIDIRLNGIKEMEDINNVAKQETFNLSEIRFKRNRIVFGAPGTGKSFKLNNEKKELVGDNEEQYERVTFHPDYSYSNFVGTYKPIMINSNEIVNQDDKEIVEVLNDKNISAQEKYDKLYDKFKDDNSLTRLSILIGLYDGGDFVAKKADGSDAAKSSVEKNHGKAIKPYVNLINNNANGDISYEYVPGPFMRLFVKAKKNPNTPYLLLIEEINRANVSAVFGDLFQLLDRDDNEESIYPVEANEDIKKFLLKKGIELENNKIKIPNNLFIWATMNSADQGVFPMDTAFKRRWDFDYIGINNNESQIENIKFNISVTNKNDSTKPMPIYWNDLRKSINKYLSDNKINEDKQLGAYFISKKILNSGRDEDFLSTFKNKVIMYLFEDAAKQKRMDMFSGSSSKGFDANRYSEICECFDKYGVECFSKTIEADYILRISSKEQEKGNE